MSILLQAFIGIILIALGAYTIMNEERLIKLEGKLAHNVKVLVENVFSAKEKKHQAVTTAKTNDVNSEYDEILAELDEFKSRTVENEKVLSLKDYFVA